MPMCFAFSRDRRVLATVLPRDYVVNTITVATRVAEYSSALGVKFVPLQPRCCAHLPPVPAKLHNPCVLCYAQFARARS